MNHNHYLVRNVCILIIVCCVGITTASDWIMRNSWSEQNNSSTWITPVGGTAVNVHYRAWGKSDFWLINSSDPISVGSGISYKATYSLINAQKYGVSEVRAALISGWDWSGPTGAYTPVAAQVTFTPGQPVTAVVTVPVSFSGSAYLALQLILPEQPRAATEYHLDNYSVVGSVTPPSDKKVLLVVGASYAPDISGGLSQYRNDIKAEGWESELLVVDRSRYPTAEDLKTVLQGYANQGVDGLFIIGSENDIPVARWIAYPGIHEYGALDTAPSLLFYMDMDAWGDSDGDGVYETWTDSTRTVFSNGNSATLAPELFCGIYNPAPFLKDIAGQINAVSAYLAKIHTYRASNRTVLSATEFNRGATMTDAGWGPAKEGPVQMGELVPNLAVSASARMSTKEGWSEFLTGGYRIAAVGVHSSPTTHSFTYFDNGVSQSSIFELNHLATLTVRTHLIQLYTCSSARFTEKNLGMQYLLSDGVCYNVCGVVTPSTLQTNDNYFTDLRDDLPVGIANLNNLRRISTEGDYENPFKFVLCGDPLLAYGAPLGNKPPQVRTALHALEACAGRTTVLPLEITDPENDPVQVTFNDLPRWAHFDDATSALRLTPPVDTREQYDTMEIVVTDSHQNTYREKFTVYVNYLEDGQMVTLDGWTQSGSGAMQTTSNLYIYGTPSKEILVHNQWKTLEQTIQVLSNTNYQLVFYVRNRLSAGRDVAVLEVPEIAHSISLAACPENSASLVKTGIYTGNNSTITLRIRCGSELQPASGTLAVTAISLFERAPFGDVNFDGMEDGADALSVMQYLLNITSFNDIERNCADVNHDGAISKHDAWYIGAFSVGLIDAPSKSFAIGDANLNGRIERDDAVLVSQFDAGIAQPSEIQKIACDVNADGVVNSIDAMLIFQYVNKLIPQFPYVKK